VRINHSGAALSVAVLAAVLSACGEGGTDTVSGENTLLSGSAVGVLDASGNDITEINDTNFERPVEPAPDAGAGSAGGDSGDSGAGGTNPDDSGLGDNINTTEYTPPDLTGLSFEPGNFLKNRLAIITLDKISNPVMLAFEALAETVVPEFQDAANAMVAYTPATQELLNRIGDKTLGCASGSINSSIVVSSSGELEWGKIVYNDCQRLYHTLNGTINLTPGSTSDPAQLAIEFGQWVQNSDGSSINVELIDFEVQSGPHGPIVLNGDMAIYVGVSERLLGGLSALKTNDLIMVSDGETTRWNNVAAYGSRDNSTGLRRASFEGTLTHDTYGELTFITAGDPVNGGSSLVGRDFASEPDQDVFTEGEIALRHEDGSRMQLRIDRDAPNFRIQYGARLDGLTQSYFLWREIRTRIPLVD